MKKAIIYVYSGTGNTKLVAEMYKEFLSEYETTIFMVLLLLSSFLFKKNSPHIYNCIFNITVRSRKVNISAIPNRSIDTAE